LAALWVCIYMEARSVQHPSFGANWEKNNPHDPW
jgi:hypothetical protein